VQQKAISYAIFVHECIFFIKTNLRAHQSTFLTLTASANPFTSKFLKCSHYFGYFDQMYHFFRTLFPDAVRTVGKKTNELEYRINWRWPDIYYCVPVTVLFLGAPSLTRGRVYLLYMLLVLTSEVFLGSETLGTSDHILLSQIRDVPFRRLLRLVGSRWRYSNPPPHGPHLTLPILNWTFLYNHLARTEQETSFITIPLLLLS
jgi:hypothetical protein